MRRDSEEVERAQADGQPRCYCDPALTKRTRTYTQFIRDLCRRGLIQYGTWAHERVWVFFVKKKSGKLRMVLDVRRANMHFEEPPRVDLLSAEGLGHIEVEPGPPGSEPVQVWCGTSDVQDAFHRLTMPAWLARYFGLPSVRAGAEAFARSMALRWVQTPRSSRCQWPYRWGSDGRSSCARIQTSRSSARSSRLVSSWLTEDVRWCCVCACPMAACLLVTTFM